MDSAMQMKSKWGIAQMQKAVELTNESSRLVLDCLFPYIHQLLVQLFLAI